MIKQNWLTVLAIVVLSVVCSLTTNLMLNLRKDAVVPEVVRARSVELVDAKGHVGGTFELVNDGQGGTMPRIALRDPNGRDSIVMRVDARGDGTLSFSNDYWNEGAIILGHLQNVDDGSESRNANVPDKRGAWGLRIRSADSRFTGIGFFNSGASIIPLSDTNEKSAKVKNPSVTKKQ
jgi:hypothetical protein